ncbi:unnamed protein product [Pleuronectes platessa]|uniref:Uncharacterized protein n=1 Tax=Pleuronectes platessa TaxID=8262 RepID=A0A9N7UCV6_PLEPL|nr:unnamed protein product [Pleuronectes platessa]
MAEESPSSKTSGQTDRCCREINAAPHLSSPPPASNELQLTKPRHMVMYSGVLHLKVIGSSKAVLTCSDCDQAMKDCEFSGKGSICLSL